MDLKEFTYEDYFDACNFALNYPDDLRLQGYNEDKDVFEVEFFIKNDAWYCFRLIGSFIRACLKENNKQWI